MENAAYLQSMEEESINQALNTEIESDISKEDIPTFEVDSIELATPELFSKETDEASFNQENNASEPTIFDDLSPKEEIETKEPEMFEENNQEEDFEIPAFLRKQKN